MWASRSNVTSVAITRFLITLLALKVWCSDDPHLSAPQNEATPARRPRVTLGNVKTGPFPKSRARSIQTWEQDQARSIYLMYVNVSKWVIHSNPTSEADPAFCMSAAFARNRQNRKRIRPARPQSRPLSSNGQDVLGPTPIPIRLGNNEASIEGASIRRQQSATSSRQGHCRGHLERFRDRILYVCRDKERSARMHYDKLEGHKRDAKFDQYMAARDYEGGPIIDSLDKEKVLKNWLRSDQFFQEKKGRAGREYKKETDRLHAGAFTIMQQVNNARRDLVAAKAEQDPSKIEVIEANLANIANMEARLARHRKAQEEQCKLPINIYIILSLSLDWTLLSYSRHCGLTGTAAVFRYQAGQGSSRVCYAGWLRHCRRGRSQRRRRGENSPQDLGRPSARPHRTKQHHLCRYQGNRTAGNYTWQRASKRACGLAIKQPLQRSECSGWEAEAWPCGRPRVDFSAARKWGAR